MLGILLLYFIGKYYNELYKEYKTEKSWPYVLLGIGTYYAGTLLAGFTIGLLSVTMDFNIDNTPDLVIGLMAVPFGILATFGVYKYLEKKWKREYVDPVAELETIGSEEVEGIN